MGKIVEFPSNGSTAQGYFAEPKGPGPGVVVIQEWWGLVPHIKDICDRFAAEGFVALAPDLYHGTVTTEPDEAGKLMMSMNIAKAAKDMGGAVDYLLGREEVVGDGVGVTGFCMGGGLALVLACSRPDAVAACAPFYGLLPWPDGQPDWSKLSAPVLGHYAARDGFFTPEAAKGLEATLHALGKEAEMRIYPDTDHAFFNDTRPEVYNADAAKKAWAATLEFFKKRLG